MSKRRVFDIDFPSDDPQPVENIDVPAGTGAQRRGPMASAIVENADALAERSAAEAAIRAENDRLAHEHVRLKKQGLITDLVPIDDIRMDKLTRDWSRSGFAVGDQVALERARVEVLEVQAEGRPTKIRVRFDTALDELHVFVFDGAELRAWQPALGDQASFQAGF